MNNADAVCGTIDLTVLNEKFKPNTINNSNATCSFCLTLGSLIRKNIISQLKQVFLINDVEHEIIETRHGWLGSDYVVRIKNAKLEFINSIINSIETYQNRI